MRVFIANFGRGNYEWPHCQARGTIATMNDFKAQAFWEAHDRDAFVNYCLKETKTATGMAPTRPVASRWFNLMSIIAETAGDLWLHREKDQFWWTTSKVDPPTFEQRVEPFGDQIVVIVCHKPCEPWSNKTRTGVSFNWNGLHPKAREFLFTEGTLQQLGEDNALYAQALIAGDDLSPWHTRPDWKARAQSTGKNPVTYFDAKRKAVWRMANTAQETVAGANGQQVLTTRKNKEFRFPNRAEFESYISALIDAQGNICMLTGLPLQFDGTCDDLEMLASLDRIDSNGHYEPGNLQIVCRFANRWKSDGDNERFLNLIRAVKSIGPM